MDIKRYIAMTRSEFSSFRSSECLPAWMACHFSPYGIGISNLPDVLPEASMIILNDIIPPYEHDPDIIANQLNELASKAKTNTFLLDFQREKNRKTEAIVKELTNKLNGKVGVTEAYAENTTCAVFLTCPLPYQPLSKKISRWDGRDLWLELAVETSIVHISTSGSKITHVNKSILNAKDSYDNVLKSRYLTEINEKQAMITIERNPETLYLLEQEAASYDIELTIGLYQQLYQK